MLTSGSLTCFWGRKGKPFASMEILASLSLCFAEVSLTAEDFACFDFLEEGEFARVQDFVRRPGKAGNWVKATLNGSRHRFLLSQSDFVGKGFELRSLQSRLWCPQDFPERAAIWLV